MRVIAFLDHGPAWLPGRSVFQQGSVMEAHLASMRRRFDEGFLLIGGPYADDSGGIAILEVEDERAARMLMEADPAVAAGVITYQVQPLLAFFDVFDSVRTDDEAARDVASRGES